MAKTKEEIQADLEALKARRQEVFDKYMAELELIDERIDNCELLLAETADLKTTLPTETEVNDKIAEIAPPVIAEEVEK